MLDQPATRAQFAIYPPGGEAVFYPGGHVPAVGALLVQPALAGTLERLVEAGAGARDRAAGIAAARRRFYRGRHRGGRRRVLRAAGRAAARERPGRLPGDGSSRRSRSRSRDARSSRQSAWTQGPVLLQALGMLAGFDLRAMGHNSPRYIHVVTEALKLAFADRERHYGDSAAVPLAGLLAPALPARAGRAHPPRSRGAGGAGARRPRARGLGAARPRARRGRRGPGAGRRHHAHRGDRSRRQHDRPDPERRGLPEVGVRAGARAARSARGARCSCSRRAIRMPSPPASGRERRW